MKLSWFLAGLILGSTGVYAQSPFLDFGAADLDSRAEIQQWYIEKEIRNGDNPYSPSDNPCR